MRFALLYFAECPAWREAAWRLRQALDFLGQTGTAITLVPVDSVADAAGVGFPGSPTITIDGEDLFPGGTTTAGLSCRVYPTAGGLAGVPERADLVAAIRERTGR